MSIKEITDDYVRYDYIAQPLTQAGSSLTQAIGACGELDT